jgi:type IV pilus assembly protein PilB
VQAQGLVLITGPTGSGKTNTLYAAIQQVSHARPQHRHARGPGRGARCRHHAGAGARALRLTFARGLRSILRQDPDIVLVGEVRDQETAELALQASLTGHLVLTTLHTNDAVAAVTRLVDMGVEPFLVASSLSLVVAQRLVRRPCTACAAPYVPSDRTLALLGISPAELEGATPLRGKGCASAPGPATAAASACTRSCRSPPRCAPCCCRRPPRRRSAPPPAPTGCSPCGRRARGRAPRRHDVRGGAARHPRRRRVGPRCPSCARALADDMVCCPTTGR